MYERWSTYQVAQPNRLNYTKFKHLTSTLNPIFRKSVVVILITMAGISAFMLTSSLLWAPPFSMAIEESECGFPVEGPDKFRYAYSSQERTMINLGLVDIERMNPFIKVQLAYATPNNILNKVLYPEMRRAFLQHAVVVKLDHAKRILSREHPSLSLVVLDAARPQYVQFEIWDWAVANNMEKYFAAPAMGSVHNYGCAVDVTLMGLDSLVDMGSRYDHFGPESEPRYHTEMLRENRLTQQQVDNRLLLKNIMRKAGFRTIQTEWWHFNGFSKEYARENYEMIP